MGLFIGPSVGAKPVYLITWRMQGNYVARSSNWMLSNHDGKGTLAWSALRVSPAT